MLDVLLDASLPESDVMYTLVDLFVAGVNTVSTTLEWVLLLTADQPHHQIRARADSLSRNSPDDRAADRNSSKGSSQGRPSYADALIRETLCYKPPLLLPRRSIVDTSVGTHRIPAGRIVLANSWALTRDRSWWESPTTFDRNAAGKKKTAVAGVESCKYIPFSIGKRVCPGSKLAQAELSVATNVLLRSVSWSPLEQRVSLREDYSKTIR